MQYNMTKNALGGGSKFGTDGGTLTTELYLANDPTVSLEAATKRYVDGKITTIQASSIVSGTMPIARFPGYSGDIDNTPGSNVLNLKNSGVTPGTYPKVTVTPKGIVTQGVSLSADDIPNLTWSKVSIDRPTTLSGFGVSDALSKSGGTMTGFMSVMNAPTQTLHAANKSYVDNFSISGGSGTATGTIERLPQTTTPTGYLRCNGALVSKTTYPALYAIFGDNAGSSNGVLPESGQPWRQQYAFNTTQSSDITGWSTDPSLPGELDSSQAIVTKNRVYLLGGTDGYETLSTVYTAPINSDGTLGAWTADTPLPVDLAYSQAIVTKNRVYLLGGSNDESDLSTVYTAPINSDGTLGTWSTGPSLPVDLRYSQAIVTQNRVYLLGGATGETAVSTTYTAPINSDGTLGTWSTGPSLPVDLAYSQAIVTQNRVYLLGGFGAPGPMATVYTAPINGDGTLGAWSTGTSLPVALYSAQAIVTQNRVYLLGGMNESDLSTVYTAPINSDGTLGTWSTGPSLAAALGYSQAIVTQNRVYLLGGYGDTSILSTVYTAPFSGGLNDYSTFYTTGYVAADPDNFRLPDYTSLESSDFKYYIKY